MGWKVIYNTLYINFFGLILGIVVPVSIAVLLQEIRHKAYKKSPKA